tara:strand:+ start:65 stop:1186 length:1122 start_codon:yes stop_codon:yes gene_type:complete
MHIRAIAGQPLKDGTMVVTGSISVKDLSARAIIPYRDPIRKRGYQRRPQDARINKFALDIRKKNADVPTSLLMNIRAGYKLNTTDSDDIRLIDIYIDDNDETKFHIVDGQHRFLAFRKLYLEDSEKWGGTRLQFVLMLGADENKEMEQFYVVNTTAKSVRTDLALDLLKQRAENDPSIVDQLTERGQIWKVKAQSITEILQKESRIWKGRIRLANQDKLDSILPAASFVASLKNALTSSPLFRKFEDEQAARVLESYWLGIRLALREPFDEDPNHYALQKGVGVTAMHELLPTVIEVVRARGGSVYDENDYANVMGPVLANLSGENIDGEPVNGSDFWLTAPRGGAAGSFSSSAGKRVLLAKLTALLPELDLE